MAVQPQQIDPPRDFVAPAALSLQQNVALHLFATSLPHHWDIGDYVRSRPHWTRD